MVMKNVTPQAERRKNRTALVPVKPREGQYGRPAYSDSVREKVLQGLRAGMPRSAAAAHGGIHRDTFFDWMKRIPEFAEAVEVAEEEAHAKYAASLRAKAAQGSTDAIKFWLERRRPADWREKVTLIPQTALEALAEVDDVDDVDRLQGIVDEARRRRAIGASEDLRGEDKPQ